MVDTKIGIIYTYFELRVTRSMGAPFFFIVMADPQIGWNQDGYNSEELFGEAINEANRLQPDFVVMCGDLIQSSGSNDQFAIFKSFADRLEMPYMTVAVITMLVIRPLQKTSIGMSIKRAFPCGILTNSTTACLSSWNQMF